MTAELHNDHSVFEEIAALLPAEQREHFYRRMACLWRLGPDDEIMQIAEAMGFLAILIRDTPQLLAAERRAVETLLQQTIATQQALHDNIKKSNTQIEDRLLDIPGEIQADIDPDTIATQIAESIRQRSFRPSCQQ